MGASGTKLNHSNKSYFIIDRLLSANCDFLKDHRDPSIRFGIVSSKGGLHRPLKKQGIRIGDDNICRLVDCTSSNSKIEYKFENNISLTIFKQPNNEVWYTLKTPKLDITRSIDPIVRKFYKPISMSDASLELDKVEEILK
jgi:hypothetical protein